MYHVHNLTIHVTYAQSIENGIFIYRNSKIQIPNNISEHYEYAMNVMYYEAHP